MENMKFIASALSAILLALALPNELTSQGVALVGFFCLSPYFAALIKSRSYGEAALLGALFGILSHGVSSYWLYFFKDFAIWTLGSTSLAYGGLHALLAVFLRRVTRIRRPQGYLLRPFLIALLWTLWEWSKSIGFLGYPWGLVAYAVQNYPRLIQIADFTGVYGLSFLLSFSSALIAEWFVQRPGARRNLWRPALIGLYIFVWFSVYGAFKLVHPTPTVDRVPLLLIQHNADTWVGGELDSLSTVMKLSRQGFESVVSQGIPVDGSRKSNSASGQSGGRFYKPALIVWSETVLRRPFEDYRPFYRKNPPDDPLIPFLAETAVPLLTGAPVVLNWETYDATNSAILIEPTSRVAFSYAKQHPVPFAEAIPFWEYPWMRNFMKNVVGLDGGWTMGTSSTVMEIPTPSKRPLRFGVPICFEDAFAGLCADFFKKGADLLINITNDSWSKTNSAEIQHFAAARFRTVENRRVLVRSTNAGLTAVVDAEGRTIAELPLFVGAYLAVSVPVQRSAIPTVYFLLGDWFPALGAMVLFLYLVWTTVEMYRRVPKRPGGVPLTDL